MDENHRVSLANVVGAVGRVRNLDAVAATCHLAECDRWARLVSNLRPLACEAVVPQARMGVNRPVDACRCAGMYADTGTRTRLVPNESWPACTKRNVFLALSDPIA
jgi:hypothetical protein